MRFVVSEVRYVILFGNYILKECNIPFSLPEVTQKIRQLREIWSYRDGDWRMRCGVDGYKFTDVSEERSSSFLRIQD
jgi:hypothetical protein